MPPGLSQALAERVTGLVYYPVRGGGGGETGLSLHVAAAVIVVAVRARLLTARSGPTRCESRNRLADHARALGSCRPSAITPPPSRISFNFLSCFGRALRSRGRAKGRSSLPRPRASISSAIVRRDRRPPFSGSTVHLATPANGPLTPRLVNCRGGLNSMTSSVVGTFQGPIRCSTVVFDPTASGDGSSRCAEMTESSHSR